MIMAKAVYPMLYVGLFVLLSGVLHAQQQEWTFHRSADGLVPSGKEQQYVWLMNRARSNPAVEGIWLSLLPEQRSRESMAFWGVDLELLREEFSSLQASAPAAFDIRLHEAARLHNAYLIENDLQVHTGQMDRVRASGFQFIRSRVCVFAYSLHPLFGHAAFNADWGDDGGITGMQPGRKHRDALMGEMTNVGIAVTLEYDEATRVGPEVTTGNYVVAKAGEPNHYNVFIVGTVWDDRNGNRMYDAGEGIGGVRVTPDSGDWFAVTGSAGGYAIPADAGTYDVVFSGGTLAEPITRSVSVGDRSVLVPWIEFTPQMPQIRLSYRADSGTLLVAWSAHLGEPAALLGSNDLRSWEWLQPPAFLLFNQLQSAFAMDGLPAAFFRAQRWSF
jgi:hypothetical protein